MITFANKLHPTDVIPLSKIIKTIPELIQNICNIPKKSNPTDTVYRRCLANYSGNDYSILFEKEFPDDNHIVINRDRDRDLQLILGVLPPMTSLYYNNPRHIKILDGPIDIELNITGHCSRFEFTNGAITIANSHFVHNDTLSRKSFLWIDKITNNDTPLL